MLKKKEKKSFGAYNDYFLEQCEVATRSYDVTHVHILNYKTFLSGIYGYEPKTGILTLEDEHIGVLSYENAYMASKNSNTIVFLRHKPTWTCMIEKGLVKEHLNEKRAIKNINLGQMVPNSNKIDILKPSQPNVKLVSKPGQPQPKQDSGFIGKLIKKITK
jgi:hypothetical protein